MRTRVVLLDKDMAKWSPPNSMDRTKAVFVYANCHSFRFAIDRKTKRSLVYATVMKMTNCYPPVDMLTTDDITNHGMPLSLSLSLSFSLSLSLSLSHVSSLLAHVWWIQMPLQPSQLVSAAVMVCNQVRFFTDDYLISVLTVRRQLCESACLCVFCVCFVVVCVCVPTNYLFAESVPK